MPTVRLALAAMATRFELVLQGADPVRLRAAGEEALAEITRLEARLSFYRPTSEISRINARAAKEPVRIAPPLFRLLQTAQRLHAETDGAFDLTVAPLMRCWGFTGQGGHLPDTLAEARRRTGMHLVTLNEADFTVSFAREGVMLDLGAIGKGYAVDEAMAVLAEAGVSCAFLHGGTSTMSAIGTPDDAPAWSVAIPRPDSDAPVPEEDEVLSVVALENEALSVSAVWGKAFVVEGKTYGHVLDPRTGWPAEGAVLAAVAAPSATETDALSTALLVLGSDAGAWMAENRTRLRALVVCHDAETGRFEALQEGIALRADGF